MTNFSAAAKSAVLSALLLVSLGTSLALAQTTTTTGYGGAGATQSSVALKTPFPTIAGTSDSVTKAIDATNYNLAVSDLGKNVTIKGTVTKVYVPASNALVILDFANDYRSAVTVIVNAANYGLFPDLTTLQGKTVLITGKMQEYKQRPQMEMTKLDQIQIIGK